MGNKNSCSADEKAEIEQMTVDMTQEEIEAYFSGTWHELVRTNVKFQKGCTDTTAEYTVQPDGSVEVINRCTRATTGKASKAKLKATKRDPASSKASFNVRFSLFPGGQYNIVYNSNGVAVVTGDCWDTTWVLARDAAIPHATLCAVLAPLVTSTGLKNHALVYDSGEPCVFDGTPAAPQATPRNRAEDRITKRKDRRKARQQSPLIAWASRTLLIM